MSKIDFVEINSAKESLHKLGVIRVSIYEDTTFAHIMKGNEICLVSYEFTKNESVTVDKVIKYLYIEATKKGLFD